MIFSQSHAEILKLHYICFEIADFFTTFIVSLPYTQIKLVLNLLFSKQLSVFGSMCPMKRLFSSFILIFCSCILLSGCTASDPNNTPEDNSPVVSETETLNTKTIYIRSVVDSRKFQKEADDRSLQVIPDDEKDVERVIGLKRNTLGMAIGTIHLHENQSVTGITKDALIKGLKNSDYSLIDKKDNLSADTLIAEVKVVKFWTWHTPGVWDIDINAEIEAVITLKNESSENKIQIKGSGKTKKNIGTEEAYHEAIALARDAILKDLKKKLH